jgi:hypothetical protein
LVEDIQTMIQGIVTIKTMKTVLLGLIATALLGVAAWTGYSWVTVKEQKKALQVSSQKDEQLRELRRFLTIRERSVAVAETKVNQHVQTIQERVVEYVQSPSSPTSVCLSPDGMRIWNDANRGPAEGEPSGSQGVSTPPGPTEAHPG